MKGRVVYVPEAAQGRLTFLGQEIPIRPEDVAPETRRPGTRVLEARIAWKVTSSGEQGSRRVDRTSLGAYVIGPPASDDRQALRPVVRSGAGSLVGSERAEIDVP